MKFFRFHTENCLGGFYMFRGDGPLKHHTQVRGSTIFFWSVFKTRVSWYLLLLTSLSLYLSISLLISFSCCLFPWPHPSLTMFFLDMFFQHIENRWTQPGRCVVQRSHSRRNLSTTPTVAQSKLPTSTHHQCKDSLSLQKRSSVWCDPFPSHNLLVHIKHFVWKRQVFQLLPAAPDDAPATAAPVSIVTTCCDSRIAGIAVLLR